MKILLFGNIGVGKTTIARKLMSLLVGFDHISIDDFRRKYGDGTMDLEIKSQNKFIEAIALDQSHQIIESSGLGQLGQRIFQKMATCEDLKVVIIPTAKRDTIQKRIDERIWDIPYPESTDCVPETIRITNEQLENGALQGLWYGHPLLSYPNQTNEDLENIIQFTYNIIKHHE